MRTVRPLALLLTTLLPALLTALLIAPAAVAEPPFRVPEQITDKAGALSPSERADVQDALDKLYDNKRIQLWVVFVESFDGQNGVSWAQDTMRASGFGDDDALLAVAVGDREYAFQVPLDTTGVSSTQADDVQRNDIEPKLRRGDWAGAAIAAANGLNTTAKPLPWGGLLTALGVIAVLGLLWWMWSRRRRRQRHEAEVEAAKRVDPTDPNALAGVPLEALDELSQTIVVDVDNAVRTSQNELTLAVEEFGEKRTEPFRAAVEAAKKTLAQAFNVRQILDDAVPETPTQRRDLLTRVIVAAAKADRELDAQSEAFEQLRDLVISAPTRLDTLTQRMVALTARLEPAEQTLAGLHRQFSDDALASVADNVDTARQRLSLADHSITSARGLVSRPAADQTGLVDAVHAAEGALQQATQLLDAVDSASSDINHAVAGLPAAIADIQNGIDAAAAQLAQPGTPQPGELTAARDAAVRAVAEADRDGASDPLGAFTAVTKADADLDRILASVTEKRQEAARQARMLEQALFTASSRVKAVSDFIDTRRGSVGPEARTRLAEAQRQLEAAQAKKSTDVTEAIAHANGAAALAARAQSLANDDARAAQRHYAGQYGGRGGADLGSVIGGIIIGNVLRGGFSGGMAASYTHPTLPTILLVLISHLSLSRNQTTIHHSASAQPHAVICLSL
ncbi:TPM domain-containing protein, partial [Mycolicibacterium palauense]|uniref:TPM domain-containing protein n=1 Tax=Mycolicibacterium palauense TaxID=2034511 RepID=UPI000BFEC825